MSLLTGDKHGHRTSSKDEDAVQQIVEDLITCKAFTKIEGRKGYPSFPEFNKSLLHDLDYRDLHKWIQEHIALRGSIYQWMYNTCQNIISITVPFLYSISSFYSEHASKLNSFFHPVLSTLTMRPPRLPQATFGLQCKTGLLKHTLFFYLCSLKDILLVSISFVKVFLLLALLML